ncbi:hypothetical protein EDD21DRAFT_100938 [Dissophora ornata]|nr:hypothetical protein BGZ58_001044 [Dissophora ornata]KAI8605858.1 hypothetical protein EDD21DRAFT_100938 [Dissophora ornata]
MASSTAKDQGTKTNSKDALDLYDGADELLDYGDQFDLETDLLDTDLVDVENYDEFDLGIDDELGLGDLENPLGENNTSSNNNSSSSANQNLHDSKQSQFGVASGDGNVKDDNEPTSTTAREPSQAPPSSSPSIATESADAQSGSGKSDHSSQQQYSHQQRDGASSFGGYSRGRPPYSTPSSRGSSMSRGGPMRGRGQNYMGMGRGAFQGRPGMGHPQMMGMNMVMGMGGIGANGAMGPNMNMGMNMNMNMPMMGMGMGMNGPRFPGDGYGNQGMLYPFGGAQGMDGSRMNAAMGGMHVRGQQGMGTPGRTIHINPNFQNRTGIPPIPGTGGVNPSQYTQQQRPQIQDSGRVQSRSWENKPNTTSAQATRSGSHDERDGRPSGRDDGRSHNRSIGTGSGSGSDHGERNSGDLYRTSVRANGDAGSLSTRGSSDRLSSDAGRSNPHDSPRNPSLPFQPQSTLVRQRSQSPQRRGSSASISNRLTPGLKRPGEDSDESFKALKSSGGATPRSEQSRSLNSAEKDTGSVSFLRDNRESTEPSGESGRGGAEDSVPRGFVKMENVPESLSDASIRKLADGISGVNRVLTVAKKGDRSVTLGFASVDEAKFFRRQINRTTIEGSLVTVTLASS